MLRVGLTGGIGSGKSTVARRLAELGATVTDADLVAREVVEPGTEALAAIRSRFGDAIIRGDGSLDRAGLAAIVFTDRAALTDLEAITGPAIAARVTQLRDAVPPGSVDVFDMPLMVEQGSWVEENVCVVVHAPVETRVARLVDSRGLPEQDARARIAAQASDDQRRAAADVWLDNSGDPAALTAAVDALWAERLRPWNANLVAGRPVGGAASIATAEPGPVRTGQGARAVARLRHQVARAGLAGRLEALEHLDPMSSMSSMAAAGAVTASAVDLRLSMASVDDLTRPELVEALHRAGFVPAERGPDRYSGTSTHWLGTDPAVVYRLECRVGPGAA